MIDPILAISAFTLGLAVLGSKGMILHKARAWVERGFTYEVTYQKAVTTTYNANATYEDVTEERVHKLFLPLWGCPACMCSIWGTLVYWVGDWMTYWSGDWFGWIISCLGACALNWILWKE